MVSLSGTNVTITAQIWPILVDKIDKTFTWLSVMWKMQIISAEAVISYWLKIMHVVKLSFITWMDQNCSPNTYTDAETAKWVKPQVQPQDVYYHPDKVIKIIRQAELSRATL